MELRMPGREEQLRLGELSLYWHPRSCSFFRILGGVREENFPRPFVNCPESAKNRAKKAQQQGKANDSVDDPGNALSHIFVRSHQIPCHSNDKELLFYS